MIRARAASTCALAAAALLAGALPARADLDVRDRIGFGGRWVVGAPTPYTVSLANSGAERVDVKLEVSCGASFGLRESVHTRVVSVEGGAARDEVFLFDGPQPWRGALQVSIEVEPKVPIRTAADATDRGSMSFERPSGNYGDVTGIEFPTHVVGVVGDLRAVVAGRLAKLGVSGTGADRPLASSRMQAVDVPPDLLRYAPLALEGLEALLVCDPDAQTCAEPAALDGVLDWVALGGTLVVSLGEHASEFAASPLAAEMPARWTGAQRTSYADLLAAIGAERSGDDTPGPWTVLRPAPTADGSAAPAPQGPMSATRRIGMGRVVVLPYDVRTLLAPSVAGDAVDLHALASALALELPAPVESREWEVSPFNGLTASFARALQQGAFEPPPLALVIFGIVVYVVVVGPLDWFVLKRLRKERLTTLTFLGAVLAFTALAFGASLLLFSAGARVNRIVVADLADGGRGGRQVLRTIDIAGFYAPRGADQPLAYSSSCVLLDSSFPGLGFGGDVGSTLPVLVGSGDPLHPEAVVQLPFRSQRVVRAHAVGTLGPTIEVEWDGSGARPAVRVTNGLPVDLDEVLVYVDPSHAYALGSVPSGARSNDGRFSDVLELRERAQGPDDDFGTRAFWGSGADISREDMRRLLEAVTIGSTRRGQEVARPTGDEKSVFRKLGLTRSGAFDRDRALVVAFASAAPVALPGSGVAGDTHVVIRKEVAKR